MSKLSFTILASLAMIASGPVAAAPATGPVALQGDVKLETKTVQNGVEKIVMVAPKVVVPGNRLLFSTSYRNESPTPVNNFVVTNPVPAGIAVAADDAAKLTVSIDGGKSWGKLATMSVKDARGVARPAQAGDVTHIRWILATIAPGASGSVAYHAIVK